MTFLSKITPKRSTRSRSLAKICFVHFEEARIWSHVANGRLPDFGSNDVYQVVLPPQTTTSGINPTDDVLNNPVAVTATTFREESAPVQLPAPPPPEPVAGSSRAIDPGLLLDPFKEGPGPSSRRVEDVIPEDVLRAIEEADQKQLELDVAIAKLLQAQFDSEYDEQLKREENHRNKNSCVKISLKNYRMVPEELLYDEEDQAEVPVDPKADWDRFETNEK
ncbi:hypothetical protein pipiens_011951 [Culex pipiens pipiens]|uniref:THAP-type domain-containing protein n=1 Tax=Culex pipiens pipiens TaxID=38569 RepID=A0ABD1D4X0_CULPP